MMVERENKWMIGDIDVNSIKIWSFHELIKYLFVLFCVKRRIVIEFCLWTNSKAKEYGYFVSFEDSAKALFDKYFFDDQVLDVTLDSEHVANEEILKYQGFYDSLVGLPFEHFMDLCPKIFDRLCELYYNRNRINEFWQPVGLSKFVCSILKESNCKSIYNPFSGLCSYSIFMDEDVYYRGQEKDFEAFQIAQLRLDAYDKANSAVYNEDVVSKLEGHFDAVVATPPFGGYFVDESDGKKRGTYYDLFLSRSLESDANLYVGVVPIGFLFGDSHKSLRKELCVHRMVEAIISLPSGVFHPYTNAKSAIVILKPRGGCNSVSFIDAAGCFNNAHHEIDDKKLLGLLHTRSNDSNYSVRVDEIEFLDFSLNPEDYETQRIEENGKITEVVRMGDVVLIDSGEIDHSNMLFNLIQDSDFCDNILALSGADEVDCKYRNNGSDEYMRFVGPHLVVKENKGNLCCYLHKSESAFCFSKSLHYLVLKLDQSKIEPLYLANFFFQNAVVRSKTVNLLHAPSVTFQRSEGKIVPFSIEGKLVELDEKMQPKKNFFERVLDKGLGLLEGFLEGEADKAAKARDGFVLIRLGISGKTEQTSFINSTISQQKQRKLQEIQAEKERWGIRETTSDIVHMLGRPFAKQQNIIGFLKSHQPTDAGYKDAVVALADVSNFIRRLVTSVGGDFSKYDYKKEDVVLSAFVQEYVRSWNNFAVKDFDLDVEDHIGGNTMVSIDKDTMMILLDAAMDNAWRHGFKKLKKEGNKVCVSLSAKDLDGILYVDMQIGNNGATIEPGLSNEVFISKGRFSRSTGRTGLGGNHIYQIAKKHDGFLSVSGGGSWSFCIDVLLPIKKHDEYLSFEPVSHKLFFV